MAHDGTTADPSAAPSSEKAKIAMVTTGSITRRWACAAGAVGLLLLGAGPVGAQNLLVNGDFSAGLDGWSTVSVAGGGFAGFPRFQVDPGVACLTARNGNHRLMINVPDEADGYVVQTLALPAEPATLSLHSWGNLDPTIATVSIQTLGDGVVHDLETWEPPPVEAAGLTCSGAQPIPKSWDLSAFAGHDVAVRLRARGGTGYNGTIADFDDVVIVAAAPTTTTTSSTTTTTVAPLCAGTSAAAAIACLCEADVPDECSGFDVPERVANRFEGVCRTAKRGLDAAAPRRTRKLLGKARRKMTALIRAVGRLEAEPTCVAALVERGRLVQASLDAARAATTP